MPLFLLRGASKCITGNAEKFLSIPADAILPGCFVRHPRPPIHPVVLSLVLLVMKSGDQIKHKLSYLSRRLTPTTRKRGRRDAAKGFRVFLGCHITVTAGPRCCYRCQDILRPQAPVPAVHPPRPSSRFIPRSLSSNETDTLRLMTNIAPHRVRNGNRIHLDPKVLISRKSQENFCLKKNSVLEIFILITKRNTVFLNRWIMSIYIFSRMMFRMLFYLHVEFIYFQRTSWARCDGRLGYSMVVNRHCVPLRNSMNMQAG